MTKYRIATRLAVPFYIYAKAQALVPGWRIVRALPLHAYCLWIAKREFGFFRHVAFDQLVTPRTVYIRRSTVETWLAAAPEVDPDSVYVTHRNGNWWTFGGRTRCGS